MNNWMTCGWCGGMVRPNKGQWITVDGNDDWVCNQCLEDEEKEQARLDAMAGAVFQEWADEAGMTVTRLEHAGSETAFSIRAQPSEPDRACDEYRYQVEVLIPAEHSIGGGPFWAVVSGMDNMPAGSKTVEQYVELCKKDPESRFRLVLVERTIIYDGLPSGWV